MFVVDWIRRGVSGVRSGGRDRLSGMAADEAGQILPLMIGTAVILLAAGMFVLLLGFASSAKTGAQTAADAAALAAEKELVAEITANHLTSAGYTAAGFDPATVCAKAQTYASLNGASVTSCQPVEDLGSQYGYDVQVQVQGNQAVSGTGSAHAAGSGTGADARARASADAVALASPTITQTSDCDASVVSGAPFAPHGGSDGLFPASGADITKGCEPKLAGALDRLGIAEHLHIVLTSGFDTNATGPSAQLAACGAAATVTGLSKVTVDTLSQFDLTQPDATQPNVVALTGVGCNTTSTDGSAGSPTFGNSNIHLVPWDGGPSGLVGGISAVGGLTGPISTNQLQNACTIFSVWKSQNLPQNVLLMALDAAETESTMGANQTSSIAFGLFQQEPSEGWGTQSMEYDPTIATQMFLDGMTTNEGAREVYASDPSAPIYVLVQDVQHSGQGSGAADGSNYAASLPQAQVYLADVLGGKCT